MGFHKAQTYSAWQICSRVGFLPRNQTVHGPHQALYLRASDLVLERETQSWHPSGSHQGGHREQLVRVRRLKLGRYRLAQNRCAQIYRSRSAHLTAKKTRYALRGRHGCRVFSIIHCNQLLNTHLLFGTSPSGRYTSLRRFILRSRMAYRDCWLAPFVGMAVVVVGGGARSDCAGWSAKERGAADRYGASRDSTYRQIC